MKHLVIRDRNGENITYSGSQFEGMENAGSKHLCVRTGVGDSGIKRYALTSTPLNDKYSKMKMRVIASGAIGEIAYIAQRFTSSSSSSSASTKTATRTSQYTSSQTMSTEYRTSLSTNTATRTSQYTSSSTLRTSSSSKTSTKTYSSSNLLLTTYFTINNPPGYAPWNYYHSFSKTTYKTHSVSGSGSGTLLRTSESATGNEVLYYTSRVIMTTTNSALSLIMSSTYRRIYNSVGGRYSSSITTTEKVDKLIPWGLQRYTKTTQVYFNTQTNGTSTTRTTLSTASSTRLSTRTTTRTSQYTSSRTLITNSSSSIRTNTASRTSQYTSTDTVTASTSTITNNANI